MNMPLQFLRDCAASLLLIATVAGWSTSAAVAQTTPFSPPPVAAAGPNQDAQEISRLLRAGRIDAAAAKVDALLARNPKDAQARFLKGLVLTDQDKTDDAVQIFRMLTEDFPELPEPYNNLGSLYASKGEFDKARMALEAAIQANPSYVTAYENLGDLYARMAGQAYDKVLQLDKSNAATQAKRSSVRNAIAPAMKPAAPATGTTPAVLPAAKLPGR